MNEWTNERSSQVSSIGNPKSETLKRSHGYIIAVGDQMYLSFGIVAAKVLAVEQRRYVAQKSSSIPVMA